VDSRSHLPLFASSSRLAHTRGHSPRGRFSTIHVPLLLRFSEEYINRDFDHEEPWWRPFAQIGASGKMSLEKAEMWPPRPHPS